MFWGVWYTVRKVVARPFQWYIRSPKTPKVSASKPRKKRCNCLAIAEHDGQKNCNGKRLRLFFAMFSTSGCVWIFRLQAPRASKCCPTSMSQYVHPLNMHICNMVACISNVHHLTIVPHLYVHSTLINTTLVYTTPSILIMTLICTTKLLSSKLPLLYDHDTR